LHEQIWWNIGRGRPFAEAEAAILDEAKEIEKQTALLESFERRGIKPN
jgi:hypothetical protein